MNHLEQSKNCIDSAQSVSLDFAPLKAQLAIAHALIALVERLDAPAPTSRIDPDAYAAIMDEVEATLGDRVRACPYCMGEECSH